MATLPDVISDRQPLSGRALDALRTEALEHGIAVIPLADPRLSEADRAKARELAERLRRP